MLSSMTKNTMETSEKNESFKLVDVKKLSLRGLVKIKIFLMSFKNGIWRRVASISM